MFQRVLAACAVTLLLVCVPSALTAQDKEVRAAEQVSAFVWLAGIWNGVTGWLTGQVAASSCAIDPDECPGGEPAQPATGGDGRCSLDPDGCPGGA